MFSLLMFIMAMKHSILILIIRSIITMRESWCQIKLHSSLRFGTMESPLSQLSDSVTFAQRVSSRNS